MAIYLYRLQPLAPFYFGEQKRHELGNRTAYFQHSADFPQQSAVLGLMRHQILLQLGMSLELKRPARSSESDAIRAIGPDSFSGGGSMQDYGHISGLSPIFATDGVHHLFPRPKEFAKKEESGIPASLRLWQKGSLAKLVLGDSTRYEDYISKYQFVSYLATANWCEKAHYGTIFHNAVYTGILKHWGVATRDDSYFRRTYKEIYTAGERVHQDPGRLSYHRKLAGRYSFGWFVRFKGGFRPASQDRIVFFGKEKSAFMLGTVKMDGTEENLDAMFPGPSDEPGGDVCKTVLLSDAYVDEDDVKKLNEHCILQLTDTVRFRNVRRSTKADYFAYRPDFGSTLNLLARGSVFFFKPEKRSTVEKCFTKHESFFQIGYNYFRTSLVKGAS